MPLGLHEGFAESGSDAGSASGAPAAAAFEVLVDAVLLPQPFALTSVKPTCGGERRIVMKRIAVADTIRC